MIRVVLRAAALLLVVAATAYALHRWAWLPLRCVHAASTGAAALDQATQQSDESKTLAVATRVRAQLQGCECVSPPDVRIPFTTGGTAAASGDPRAAIPELQRALAIDRRPEIYLALGFAQLDAMDRASAIENIVRAVAFDPARLGQIPYPDVRQETKKRIWERYGREWLR